MKNGHLGDLLDGGQHLQYQPLWEDRKGKNDLAFLYHSS